MSVMNGHTIMADMSPVIFFFWLMQDNSTFSRLTLIIATLGQTWIKRSLGSSFWSCWISSERMTIGGESAARVGGGLLRERDVYIIPLEFWEIYEFCNCFYEKKIYIFACILRFTFFWYEDCMVYKITKVESFIKVWSKKKQQRRPGYSNN